MRCSCMIYNSIPSLTSCLLKPFCPSFGFIDQENVLFSLLILGLWFNIQQIPARRFLRNLLSLLKLENRFMFRKKSLQVRKENVGINLCEIVYTSWSQNLENQCPYSKKAFPWMQSTSIQKPWNISSEWRFKNHENG